MGSVGNANRTVRGTIINVRDVRIQGTNALGAGTGIAGGAVAGSAIGGGTRANALGALGGAVAGGLAGAMLEEGITKQMGREYVIETPNGNLLTVVQGAEPLLYEGDAVLVIYGNPSRVILD